ncbi:hypothetical protein QQ045_014986 [Rhodiola kirilowii]
MVSLSYPVERKEGETVELPSDAIERVVQLFKESMARVAEFEQLADNRKELLHGYRQGLESLRRPPIKRAKDFVTKLEVLKEETITAMQCANDASIQLCKDPSNIVEEADDTSTSTEGSVSSET